MHGKQWGWTGGKLGGRWFGVRVMLYIATLVDGVDDTSRIIRRTLVRYLTLGSLIVFQATSVRVKKRFPTMDHILEAGKTMVMMLAIFHKCPRTHLFFAT